MELLQLKYFCVAAESESFSFTAKKFGVPASDISQSIKRLETELSCAFFTRRANSVKLNAKGVAFYKKISSALAMMDDAMKEATDDGISGSIRIGINVNRRIVMQTVEKFRNLYPNVDISVRYSVYSDFDDFDLIIGGDDMKDYGFSARKLLCEELVLAVSVESNLASKDAVTASDLRNENFVSMNKGANLYSVTEEIGKKMGFTPHIVIQGDDPFYIRRCVEMGLGIAIVPSFSWKGQFSGSVIFKRLGEFYRDTYVCFDNKKYMSGCVEKFFKLLCEEGKIATE